MHHLFIINPAAGSRNRTDDYSEVIHKICRARKLDYEIRVSTAPGEAIRIAREAALEAALPVLEGLPERVEAVTRTGREGSARFLFNNDDKPKTFTLEGQQLSLAPFEMKILPC